jgi:lysophospholipase L1-like esterase
LNAARPRTLIRGVQTLALLSCGVGAGLGLSELALRLFRPQPLFVPFADRYAGVPAPRPGVRGRQFVPGAFDLELSINGQRFRRVEETRTAPAPGRRRIAVLGDSFAFGWGAGDDQTYPARLEADLAAKRLSTEVLNAGYPGHGMGEKALWYDVWVRRFSPELVILTVLADDPDGDQAFPMFVRGAHGVEPIDEATRVAHPPPAKGFPDVGQDPSALYSALSEQSQLFAFLRKRLISHVELPELNNLEWARQLALSIDEIRWLNGRIRDAGARLIIVFFPMHDMVYGSTAPWVTRYHWKVSRLVAALVDLDAADGIPFLDLTPQFRAAARGSETLYYVPADYHPTPSGYALAARAVADFVARSWLRAPG